MKKKKDDYDWDAWYHMRHMDLDRMTEKIVGENLGLNRTSEIIQGIGLDNSHNFFLEKDEIMCTTKCTPKWTIGYKYYDKIDSFSKLLAQINRLRAKYKKINRWAVILPETYAKKYSQKLYLAGITTIAEKRKSKMIVQKNISVVKKSKDSLNIIKEIISKLEKSVGLDVPTEDIMKEVRKNGITPNMLNADIEKLKKNGEIFEPKTGFIQRI